MPTYSYTCKDCGHAFDTVQAFSDDALTQCPQCEGTLRKVWGSVGVVFKGSGFYRNDSRDADKKKAGSSGKSESSGSGDSKSADPKTGGSATDSGSSKESSKSGKSAAATSDNSSSTTSKPAKTSSSTGSGGSSSTSAS